jgi:hypothetical protein
MARATNMNTGFRLNVLVLRESAGDKAYWVAQCLEYDIVAQAETIQDLQCKFVHLLATNIILGLQRGIEPLSNLKPAPQFYWQQYEKGRNVGGDFPVSVPGDRIPKHLRDLSSRIPRGEASMRLAQMV